MTEKNPAVKVETTTAREKELLAMLYEKNSLIEQLAGEKTALHTELAKVRGELEKLTPQKEEAKGGKK